MQLLHSWHSVVSLAACTLGAALFCLPAQHALSQEWTRFRGPNGTGIAQDIHLPADWSQAKTVFKTVLPGQGHSSPVLWGTKVFLTSADEATATRYVLCLDGEKGDILWQKEFSSSPHDKHRFNSYASATAAADEKHVYVTWSTPEAYTLMALTHSGDIAWERNLGPYISQHSCGISPIVYKELVILGNEQDEEGGGKSFLVAVDRNTGDTKWQLPRTSAIVAYSTPFLFDRGDGSQELIFNSQAHGITALEPNTGSLLWEANELFDKRSVSSSLTADGLLIGTCGSGGGGNYLVAIRPSPVQKVGPADVVFKVEESAPYVPTPLYKDGLLFLWADNGTATCIDAATANVHWRERVSTGGSSNFFGSPICIGDQLVCISVTGEGYVLRASDTYERMAVNPLEEACHSTPAVANGKLYVRTVSTLVCISPKGE